MSWIIIIYLFFHLLFVFYRRSVRKKHNKYKKHSMARGLKPHTVRLLADIFFCFLLLSTHFSPNVIEISRSMWSFSFAAVTFNVCALRQTVCCVQKLWRRDETRAETANTSSGTIEMQILARCGHIMCYIQRGRGTETLRSPRFPLMAMNEILIDIGHDFTPLGLIENE